MQALPSLCGSQVYALDAAANDTIACTEIADHPASNPFTQNNVTALLAWLLRLRPATEVRLIRLQLEMDQQ